MTRLVCPDCGFVHDCEIEEKRLNEQHITDRSSRQIKGYSIYYVPCRCGCGCGHTCELMYGPYARAHNAEGKAALEGEVGNQLKAMREAGARIRREHLAKLHGIADN